MVKRIVSGKVLYLLLFVVMLGLAVSRGDLEYDE